MLNHTTTTDVATYDSSHLLRYTVVRLKVQVQAQVLAQTVILSLHLSLATTLHIHSQPRSTYNATATLFADSATDRHHGYHSRVCRYISL